MDKYKEEFEKIFTPDTWVEFVAVNNDTEQDCIVVKTVVSVPVIMRMAIEGPVPHIQILKDYMRKNCLEGAVVILEEKIKSGPV